MVASPALRQRVAFTYPEVAMHVSAKIWLGLVAVALLSACATEPPPPLMSPYSETGRYGYIDQQTGRDSYKISYIGPPVRTASHRPDRADDAKAAKAKAYDFALWRAAQVALDGGYEGFAVDNQDHEVEVTVNQGSYPYRRPYYGPHFGHYGRFGGRYGYFYGGYPYYGFGGYSLYRYTTLRATVTLSVAMRKEAGKDDFDAAATAARQAAKYPAAAASPPTDAGSGY
jgi:hypothetical protein